MTNPWPGLDWAKRPLVLDEDQPFVQAFNRLRRSIGQQDHLLQLDLPPEPWVGNPVTCRVLLLLSNPGHEEGDADAYALPGVNDHVRANLTLRESEWALHWLRPEVADTFPGDWWRRTMKALLREFEPAQVAQAVCGMELHGYHSHRWIQPEVTLPSQHVGFALVAEAIKRGAVIVMCRGSAYWRTGVPELWDAQVFTLNSHRQGAVSKGNMTADGWAAVLKAVGNARS